MLVRSDPQNGRSSAVASPVCAAGGEGAADRVTAAAAAGVASLAPLASGVASRRPPSNRTCRALKVTGPIGSTTASSDGVQVGADPGGDGGALARVGVQRLQAGERAGVHLADVLVDGLDVGAALLDREGDDQPAGEVQPPGCRRGRTRPGPTGTAGASGRARRVQPLDHRLGADVGGDLRAAVRLRRCSGTLVIARKPIAPGANGRRNRAAASAWVRAGAVRRRCVLLA